MRDALNLSEGVKLRVELQVWRIFGTQQRFNGQFPDSYADAFAAALAQKYECPLITGDREFRSVPHRQLHWIGG